MTELQARTNVSSCPESFAKWYCMNGATCFSLLIEESSFYNCWCRDGFHGARCDYKYTTKTISPGEEEAVSPSPSSSNVHETTSEQISFTVANVADPHHRLLAEGERTFGGHGLQFQAHRRFSTERPPAVGLVVACYLSFFALLVLTLALIFRFIKIRKVQREFNDEAIIDTFPSDRKAVQKQQILTGGNSASFCASQGNSFAEENSTHELASLALSNFAFTAQSPSLRRPAQMISHSRGENFSTRTRATANGHDANECSISAVGLCDAIWTEARQAQSSMPFNCCNRATLAGTPSTEDNPDGVPLRQHPLVSAGKLMASNAGGRTIGAGLNANRFPLSVSQQAADAVNQRPVVARDTALHSRLQDSVRRYRYLVAQAAAISGDRRETCAREQINGPTESSNSDHH